MAKRQNKTYEAGDRLQVYLANSLSDEFLDWINQQSDKSGFFLYAAAKLYEETGPIDVAEQIPRKLVLKGKNPIDQSSTETSSKKEDVYIHEKLDEPKEKTAWSGTDDLGDDSTWG